MAAGLSTSIFKKMRFCSLLTCPGKRHSGSGVSCRNLAGSRPLTDAPGVDMHETRGGIIAHAAASQPESGAPQIGQAATGQGDIDGLAGHVQAAGGDPAAGSLQFRIAGRRAVTGNDVKLPSCAGLALQRKEKLQQVRIYRVDFIGAVVAQNAVDPGQRFGNEISPG